MPLRRRFYQSYLDLSLLTSNWFLLLASILLLVIVIVGEVDLDAQGIADLVDTRTLRTHNTSHKLAPNLEFRRLWIYQGSS